MTAEPTDEEFLAGLGSVLRRSDPVPDAVVTAARAVFTDRDPLAGSVEPFSVIGDSPMRLTFALDDGTVELEISAVAGRVRVVGQVSPAALARISVAAQVPTDPPTSGNVDSHRVGVTAE